MEPMKIFILNRGSSSIKCYLYDFKNFPHHFVSPIWEAHLQWKNTFDEPSLTIKNDKRTRHSEISKEKTAGQALKHLMNFLTQGKAAVLQSLDEIDAVGHRVVHGGKDFSKSVLVTPQVKEKIRRLAEFAPLHNLFELEGIEILEELFKDKPQIAVFDTAFHHTLPNAAKVYPGPYKWYEEGIERYGFHGISFQYCSKRGAEILKQDLNRLKMIICHLGSGASLCAIKESKSIDTTMGFTPLEGLMMDTRSGSIDPGIILHFLTKKQKSLEEISHELYHESGLLGISGISSDMRDIIEKTLQGNDRATLALDVYTHRLNALICAMMASLKGTDVLIFTAGIGENAPLLRERVCDAFSFLGLKLDKKKNAQISSEDRELSTTDSKIKVLLIHTQEAFEVASECWKKLSNPQAG